MFEYHWASSDNRAKSMMVVPLINTDNERCLGAVVMQNKREFDGEIAEFNEEDAEVMETFAKYSGKET